MKKSVLIFCSLMLCSCSAYQQIATLSSPHVSQNDSGSFFYAGGAVTIDYNFWAESGKVAFMITNKTEKDIYVDLSRSFLVVNGVAFDYFQNRTFSSNTSSTFERSSAYGSSSTYSTGSANGMYNDIFSTVDASASSRTTGYTSKTTSSKTFYNGLSRKEKEGVWIPAHSSRYFNEFSLLSAPYRKCGFPRNPSRKENAILAFTENDSPYRFDNVLMLLIDGVEQRLVNTFYVAELHNILRKDTYYDEDELNCNGEKTGQKLRVYKYRSSNRFYIDYDLDGYEEVAGDDRIKNKSKKEIKRDSMFVF